MYKRQALCGFHDFLAARVDKLMIVSLQANSCLLYTSNQRDSIDVVDDLCIDVRIAAIDIQARSFGRAGDLAAHSGVALHTLRILIKRFNHYGTPPNYFLPPALPSLWRMTSVVYLIP